ncbi:MAG: cell division protein ZapA [Treponema sp.]|nr:cell division protein ZapA [Treponema sp.]
MTNEKTTGQQGSERAGSVLSLDILGTSFLIKTDADEEYLNEVLKKYKAAIKNTQNISGISEPLNVAILTGFLLCDEFIKIEKQLNEANEATLSGRVELSNKETDNVHTASLKESDEEELNKAHEAREAEERTLRLIMKLEQALRLYNDE